MKTDAGTTLLKHYLQDLTSLSYNLKHMSCFFFFSFFFFFKYNVQNDESINKSQKLGKVLEILFNFRYLFGVFVCRTMSVSACTLVHKFTRMCLGLCTRAFVCVCEEAVVR